MTHIEQEIIYHGKEYKKYFRSLRYLKMPIFILSLSIFGLVTFTALLIYPDEKNQGINLFHIVAVIFIIVGIGLIIFSGLYLMDMIQERVRVIDVETIGITYNKNSQLLKYKHHSVEFSLVLPSKWRINSSLRPQKAKIWITYHARAILRIEFLETGEIFDVNNKVT